MGQRRQRFHSARNPRFAVGMRITTSNFEFSGGGMMVLGFEDQMQQVIRLSKLAIPIQTHQLRNACLGVIEIFQMVLRDGSMKVDLRIDVLRVRFDQGIGYSHGSLPVPGI